MFSFVFSDTQKNLLSKRFSMTKRIWRKGRVLLLGVLLCGGAVACGPTKPEDKVMWATKNRDQRLTWMGTEVLPAMAKLFEEFDSARYKGKFSCNRCHGENYTTVDYKMPHTLFPMDPKNPITENDSDPNLAKYAKFMKEKVVPEMKRLMGKDDITCAYCHASK